MVAKSIISVADATFIGTVLEGVFYGILVVLYGVFRWIRTKQSGRDYFSGSITLLMILCTCYFGVDLCQQYLTLLADVEDGAAAWKLNQAASVLYSVIDFISQIILQYRCYLIWNRRWYVVALPFLMSLAALGGEFALVGLLASVTPDRIREIVPTLIPTGNAAFSISLAVNTCTTLLIVLRIHLMSKDVVSAPQIGNKHIRAAIAMMVESGLLTFLVQLSWVVLFSLDRHPGYYMIGGPTTMIYGITPTILAVRVCLGASYEYTTTRAESTTLEFVSQRTGRSTKTTTTQQPDGINVELDAMSDNGHRDRVSEVSEAEKGEAR